jgi:hypothetical protein
METMKYKKGTKKKNWQRLLFHYYQNLIDKNTDKILARFSKLFAPK